jgi:hypothetical protein
MFCDICESVAQGLSHSMHAAAISTALVATPAQDGAVANPGVGAYVIGNVTVIDVERGEALPGRWVRIEDGAIRGIESEASPDFIADATVIDAEGQYLIPGLFDAHVHYTPSPETFGPMLVVHGVTCVRDLGGMTEVIIALREQSRTTDVFAPEIVCTGAIIDGDPPVWAFSEPCDTEAEARAAVRKLHKAGVDQIKVYSLLKPEVHAAAIDEAHKLGLKAVGHVPDRITYDQLIESGQDCVEHMQGLDKLILSLSEQGLSDEDLSEPFNSMRGFGEYDNVDHAKLRAGGRRMKDAGMAMCPTIVVMAGISRASDESAKNDPRMEFVPAMLRSFWDMSQFADAAEFNSSIVPNLVKLAGDLHAEGVTLMVGTDLANAYVFPGSAVHEEMAHFAKAGIPAADILRSATITPAKFCGIDDKLGSIAAGKSASLVLLRENPLDDIANAQEIEAVFLRGRYYDRAALDAELDKVRDIVKGSEPRKDAIALELPGEVLYRGRYTMKFQEFDAGSEDFLITQTGEGVHVQAHLQPQGGPQGPSLVTVHAGADGEITSAEYQVLSQATVTARYTRTGDAIAVQAQQGEAAAQTQDVTLGANALFSAPVAAGDFLLHRQWKLAVGETREYELHTFGFPSWQLVSTPTKMTRFEDEQFTMPDGTNVTAQVHETTFTSEFGEMTSRTWSHPSGLTLRTVLSMQFGKVTITLASLETE